MWLFLNYGVPRVYTTAWNWLCKIWLHPGTCLGPTLAGLNKLILGFSILSELVFWLVFHRHQHQPGSTKQAQTWSDWFDRIITQEAPAFDETRQLVFVSWYADDDPLDQFSISQRIVAYELYVIQNITICRWLTVIKSIFWLVSIGCWNYGFCELE